MTWWHVLAFIVGVVVGVAFTAVAGWFWLCGSAGLAEAEGGLQ